MYFKICNLPLKSSNKENSMFPCKIQTFNEKNLQVYMIFSGKYETFQSYLMMLAFPWVPSQKDISKAASIFKKTISINQQINKVEKHSISI